MRCPNCGSEVDEGALTCPHCQIDLSLTQRIPVAQAHWCPHCGALVPAAAESCPKCGSSATGGACHSFSSSHQAYARYQAPRD